MLSFTITAPTGTSNLLYAFFEYLKLGIEFDFGIDGLKPEKSSSIARVEHIKFPVSKDSFSRAAQLLGSVLPVKVKKNRRQLKRCVVV